jgi:hypothetical protein
MIVSARALGRCLCGAVRYELRGQLRDVVLLPLHRVPAPVRTRPRGECGSSLFWDASERDIISVAAGGLDGPTRLRLLAHVFVSQAGDYHDLPEDGLRRHQRLSPT